MSRVFEKYSVPIQVKLDNFEKYVRRQSLSRFLARYELFKMQMNVKGCIIECGVHHGGGLMAWAKLSSAFEPYSLDRRIFGFDTFAGFTEINVQDEGVETNADRIEGGFKTDYDTYAELLELKSEYDQNRYLNQYEKLFLIKGDALATIPQFIQEHPYILVSLLFLDFDLYKPTRVALENFLPRMSKGSILAFDEVNNPWWPGETKSMLELIDIKKYEINRFTFDPNIAYIIL